MNESILLIEDEPELCNILTLRLNKDGHAVDTAGDGVREAGWIGDSNCHAHGSHPER